MKNRVFRLGFILVALLSSLLGTAFADRLDEIKARGTLIWGGDEEGGAPYVFRDDKDRDKLIGFEVEIAEMIAAELGVKAEFKQGQWQNLPQLLDNKQIDIVINGYELIPSIQENYACSRPYYNYALQLLVLKKSPIQSWQDLRASKEHKRYRVGVLSQTAAQRYMDEQYGEQKKDQSAADIEVVPFDSATDCMAKLKSGDLEATVQDDCFAIYYADEWPEVRFVERPVASGYYAALMKKDEKRLQTAVNDALAKVMTPEKIQLLYDKWKLGGRAQYLALRTVPAYVDEEREATKPSFVETLKANFWTLAEAAWMTVKLSFIAMPLAIMLGMTVAVGRMYGPWWIAKPLTLYVEVIRGTPLMLQLFFIYFLLPEIGINLSAFHSAILGLAINYSAYEAEIYRAGLQAVPSGQMEAALSLGLTKLQAIWHVILPQAFRIVIPPVTNDFIALFKDTSVCSVVTVVELTKQYNILARDNPSALLHFAAITACLYMLMSYPLSRFARWSERKLAGAKREAGAV